MRVFQLKMTYVMQAKNGYGSFVIFDNKPVYYRYHCGEQQDTLGWKMNKSNWIKEHVNTIESEVDVRNMLKNWCIYENGWLFIHNDSSDTAHLFNYLCQLGTNSSHALRSN